MITSDLTERLTELIETMQRPQIPVDKQLWDAAAVGAYLGVGARQVAERYALRGDFPAALRLPSDKGLGQQRWKAAEVMAWAEKLRDRKARS